MISSASPQNVSSQQATDGKRYRSPESIADKWAKGMTEYVIRRRLEKTMRKDILKDLSRHVDIAGLCSRNEISVHPC